MASHVLVFKRYVFYHVLSYLERLVRCIGYRIWNDGEVMKYSLENRGMIRTWTILRTEETTRTRSSERD
jgi:hypothetical protein